MSWIKIEKDNREYLVSSESYEELFRHQGYKVVKGNECPTPKNSIKKTDTQPKEVVENERVQPKVSRPNKNNNTRKV